MLFFYSYPNEQMSFGCELLNCALHAMINLGGISSACQDGALAKAGRVPQMMGRDEARPSEFRFAIPSPRVEDGRSK